MLLHDWEVKSACNYDEGLNSYHYLYICFSPFVLTHGTNSRQSNSGPQGLLRLRARRKTAHEKGIE